jgi:hypothetical protein
MHGSVVPHREGTKISHLTTVVTQFRDPAAIKAAAKALGIEVVENAKARFFMGMSQTCDLVLKLPGRYDLGMLRQPNGTYSFVCDEELIGGKYGTDGFGRGDAGRKLIGEEGRRLKQEYALAILQAEARRKGRTLRTEQLKNGSIRVVMSGGR